MGKIALTGHRLAALFLVGLLAVNYPLLSLFDRGESWFGVPALYVYIFGAWGLLIGLMAWIIER